MNAIPSSPDEGRPLTIRYTLGVVPEGIELYTPGGSLKWGGTIFEVNPPQERPCDFWIIHGYCADIERARVAPSNTLFINGEPPAKKRFPPAFYRQFHHVVDTRADIGHPRVMVHAPCVGWFVGMDFSTARYKYGYDYLKLLPPPAKQNLVSVVCSSTAKTRGQRERLRFLEKLKKRLGTRIRHFGAGFEPVEDKMDVIAPCRFNLVLENSVSPHYWTEKLADAYLGWALPIYSGCPNLADYFPRDSFVPIDIRDEEGSIRIIERLLEAKEALPSAALAEARNLILDRYNAFAFCHRLARQLHVEASSELVTIRNHRAFRGIRRLLPWLPLSPRQRASG